MLDNPVLFWQPWFSPFCLARRSTGIIH
jgi:hypothetical protein